MSHNNKGKVAVYRDSKNGQFIPKKIADKRPATSEKEHYRRK